MSTEEPVGVMKCFECIEKHARDLEHHLEDLIRSEKSPEKRLEYEEAIDFIRDLRRKAHKEAKDIAIEPLELPKPSKDMTKYWEKPPYEKLYPPKAEHSEESEEEEIHFSEPIRRERGKEVYVDVYHEKEECHAGSFRTIKPNPEHILTVCCPFGQYSEEAGRCLVGTMAQKLEHLHPEGEGGCPVCEALA